MSVSRKENVDRDGTWPGHEGGPVGAFGSIDEPDFDDEPTGIVSVEHAMPGSASTPMSMLTPTPISKQASKSVSTSGPAARTDDPLVLAMVRLSRSMDQVVHVVQALVAALILLAIAVLAVMLG